MSRDPAERFRRLIRTQGPISVAQFMGESNALYYAYRDPLGTAGDFITAPEVSQMFGELLGAWLADIWARAGKPDRVAYVELGPGRGTLASDALRVMRGVGLELEVHLVEGSPELRKLQAKAVPQAQFHDDLASVPDDMPLLVLANEFFDALPVRQLVKAQDGWRERMIGLTGDAFTYVAGDTPMDAAVPDALSCAETGTIIETGPAAAAVMRELAGRLASHGGAALVIDYGYLAPQTGSTLQAVKAHRKVDPLSLPGEADLTAHVDFHTLAEVAQGAGAKVIGTAEQGEFLESLGLAARASALARAAPENLDDLKAAHRRLAHPEEMGSLFKVLGLAAPDWPDGAGFVA
ncbi:class I SAM-dependent methyltransferase [Altererythrobacter sp. MF3-039]|uniref:class I SAM-dependent methyltransferase n=1 Tax=Altererythrobacter sp. MF3-039 TaxID=3252901 RepID=UPI00390C454C